MNGHRGLTICRMKIRIYIDKMDKAGTDWSGPFTETKECHWIFWVRLTNKKKVIAENFKGINGKTNVSAILGVVVRG